MRNYAFKTTSIFLSVCCVSLSRSCQMVVLLDISYNNILYYEACHDKVIFLSYTSIRTFELFTCKCTFL